VRGGFAGFVRHENGDVSVIGPPAAAVFALGISTHGVVVGYLRGHRGLQHGFIWTP